MKSLLLLTLAASSIAITAQARIGYTLDQCVKEYGPYKMRQSWVGTVYDFQVKDERVTIVIQKNLVSSIEYVKPTGVQFEINEIDDILDKNKGNSVWGSPTPNIGDGIEHKWLTATGPELVARQAPSYLAVYTKEQMDLDIVLDEKRKRDALATAEGAKDYVQRFFKSCGSKSTVDSCSVFVPKTFGNQHFLVAKTLLTLLPESSTKQTVGIIVSLDEDQKLTGIQSMEENKFYKFVTTGDTALLQQDTILDVNAKPTSTSTPETAQAPTGNRDKLKQLIANPTSDMSSLSDEELQQAAQLDAQSYYVAHKQKAYERNFAVARALKHNLLGQPAFTYQYALQTTQEALAATDGTTN